MPSLSDGPFRFSVLDLANVREGATIADAFRHTVELARHVEAHGYHRFWLAEHHNMPGIASAATAVVIGHVAGQTERIRVGSGGVMLPNHASLVIAEQFGTLETLYPGRIDLGLGRAPGSDGVTARALRRGLHDVEEDFPRQVRELLAYLGPVSPGQPVQAVPGGGTNVPVWLLGSSTYSAQLAARMGLPFAFAAHFAPQQMHDALTLYRDHFSPSPWLDRSYAMVAVQMIAGESDEHAAWLGTSPIQRFLRLIRGETLFLPPPVESMAGRWSASEKLLVESKLNAALIGGPETVERKARELLAATGVDELMVVSDVYDPAERLDSYRRMAQILGRIAPTRAGVHLSQV